MLMRSDCKGGLEEACHHCEGLDGDVSGEL